MSQFNRQNGNHILVTMIGACLKVFSKGFAKIEGGTAEGKRDYVLCSWKSDAGKALRARLEKDGLNDQSLLRLVLVLQPQKTGEYKGRNGKTYNNFSDVAFVADYDVIEEGHGDNVKYVPYQAEATETTESQTNENPAPATVGASTSYTAEDDIE